MTQKVASQKTAAEKLNEMLNLNPNLPLKNHQPRSVGLVERQIDQHLALQGKLEKINSCPQGRFLMMTEA